MYNNGPFREEKDRERERDKIIMSNYTFKIVVKY